MLSNFEWLVALRYLRMQTTRSRKLHWVTAFLFLLVILFTAGSYALEHVHALDAGKLLDLRLRLGPILRVAKLISMVAFVLVGAFIVLVRRLTIFTTISTYGLFLGSGALVIVLSVMSGFEADLKHKILGTNADIVVTTPDRPFTHYESIRDRVAHLHGVVGVTPYITNEVMISSQSNLSGVIVKGIDPATVGQVTDLKRNIEAGKLDYLSAPDKLRDLGEAPFDPTADGDAPKQLDAGAAEKLGRGPPPHATAGKPDPASMQFARKVVPGVIIGRELAKNLRLYLADDVDIVSPLGGIGPTGPIPKAKPFRVAGIFYSGMFEYDTKYIYISLAAAQKFFDQPGEVTGLELKVADPDRTEPVLAELKTTLGPGYDVQDWKELNRNLFSALKIEKILMFVLLCFIILVAAFSIIANGIMLVMEKGREIAILKSMGASDRAVLVVFLILGLYMGGLGTIAGIAMGIGTCLLLGHFGLPLDPDVYYITQLPVNMSAGEIATVFVAALAIALLATLYPAWVAARLRPVEGLREGNH